MNIGLRTPAEVPSFALWFFDEDDAAADFIDDWWVREKRPEVARGILDCHGGVDKYKCTTAGRKKCNEVKTRDFRPKRAEAPNIAGRLVQVVKLPGSTIEYLDHHVQEAFGESKDFWYAIIVVHRRCD